MLPEEQEGALLHRGGVFELRLSEPTVVPEVEPLEVVRPELDIILVPMVLEEEHLVAPLRASRLRTGHNVTNQSVLATVLRRHVVTEDLEHDCVLGDEAQLVLEVVLVLVRPSVDIIGLDIDLERPVWLLLLVSVLIKLGELHDRHGTGMVSDLGQVLANALSGADVFHLYQDVSPTILKEVE